MGRESDIEILEDVCNTLVQVSSDLLDVKDKLVKKEVRELSRDMDTHYHEVQELIDKLTGD